MAGAQSLERFPLHLGLGATAVPQPEFSGRWTGTWTMPRATPVTVRRAGWSRCTAFTDNWTAWEMHPVGAEVVVCVEGEITLIQQLADGSTEQVLLGHGRICDQPARGLAHRRCRAKRHRAVHNRRFGNAEPAALTGLQGDE